MNDLGKTKEQLIEELKQLQEELALFKALSSGNIQILGALKDFKGIYESFYKSNPHPMWIYDLKTLAFLDVNDAAIKHYGYSREEFLSRTIKDIRPPEDVPALLENISKVTEGLDIAGVWRHVKKDGTLIYVEIISHTLIFAGRRSELVLAFDITERKMAEEGLLENRERLESIFRASPTGIGLVRDRILLDVNPRICEMTGYNKEELVGKSARILYRTQEDFEYVGTEKYRQIAEKGTGTVETRWMKKDSTIIDVLLSSTPLDLNDFSKGVTFTALDITERKQAEEALRDSEEKYYGAIDNASDMMLFADLDGNIIEGNIKAEEMLGYTKEELIAMHYSKIHPPEELERTFAVFNEIVMKGNGYLRDGIILRKDGKTIPVDITGSLIAFAGKLVALGIFRDVTDRKKAEDKLRKNEKELRKRVKELEEFYNIAVGRELRMIELKKEIERLNKELEKEKNKY